MQGLLAAILGRFCWTCGCKLGRKLKPKSISTKHQNLKSFWWGGGPGHGGEEFSPSLVGGIPRPPAQANQEITSAFFPIRKDGQNFDRFWNWFFHQFGTMLTLKMTPKSVQNQSNCSHETNLISKPLGNRLFNFKSISDSFWICGNGNVLGENAWGGPLMHNAITGLSRRFKSGSLLNQPFGPKLQIWAHILSQEPTESHLTASLVL